jgi:hypothetical protein
MGSPYRAKMSGVSALLSRAATASDQAGPQDEDAPGASAATRNLMSVFMCLLILLLSIVVPTDGQRSP